jgi:hypothetical protein
VALSCLSASYPLPIRHNEFEAMPRAGEQYRCHVCRLELVMDPNTGALTVAVIDAKPPRVIARDTPRRRTLDIVRRPGGCGPRLAACQMCP